MYLDTHFFTVTRLGEDDNFPIAVLLNRVAARRLIEIIDATNLIEPGLLAFRAKLAKLLGEVNG